MKVASPRRELLTRHRDDIDTIARRHRASNVRVFGSVARGDDDGESDIDLLVDFDDNASLWDVAGLKLDLEELLGVSVDVVSSGGLLPWDDHIRQEATAL